MPFPLIAGAVVAGVAAAVGLVGGAAALGVFTKLKRSTYVLIGPKMSGKSTWRTFLSEGKISRVYDPTAAQETVDVDIYLKHLKLKFRIHDMSGNPDVINKDWLDQARKANHIFYFVDLTRLADPDYREVAHRSARIMSRWDDMEVELTLVGTHADLDPEWSVAGAQRVHERPDIVALRRDLGAVRVVIGELATDDGCQRLTLEALLPLTRRK